MWPGPEEGRYSVQTTPPDYDSHRVILKVDEASWEDAGQYQCSLGDYWTRAVDVYVIGESATKECEN